MAEKNISEVQETFQQAIRDLNGTIFSISHKLDNRQLELAIDAIKLLEKILEA